MPPKKIFFVISGINKALAFEWLAESLDRKKFEAEFILLNEKNTVFEEFLKKLNYPVRRISAASKTQIASAVLKLFKIFRQEKPDIVHCHLFEANIAGLTAAWLAGINKRIYTRHHSTLQHQYFPSGVKYDKWCNQRATHIIAVSEVVKKTLTDLEHVDEKKITLIHHGLKKEALLLKHGHVEALKKKYGVSGHFPVIGIISRYLHLKGVEYAIEGFRLLRQKFPDAMLILANAGGDYSDRIRKELLKLPENSYLEIEFEEDLFHLYRLFDVFLHVPVDPDAEAFGQTYIEALSVGIPSVFTISGVAGEFIVDKKNALVVDYKNSSQIHEAMVEILKNNQLRNNLIENGKNTLTVFDFEKSLQKLELLYLS